jgi:hypothetical protein
MVKYIASGRLVYDRLGRVIQAGEPVIVDGYGYQEIPVKNPSTWNYDLLSRVTNVVLPGDRILRAKYSLDRKEVIDPKGRVRTAFFDQWGQVTNITEPGGVVTTEYVHWLVENRFSFSV